jgi:uncharacterized protein (DUF3084 family)
VVSASGSRDAEMVRRVGSRIAAAIKTYYDSKGQTSVLEGYQWEFNLVDNKEINAWCMPGGKVVVYTGLLPVTQNEAGPRDCTCRCTTRQRKNEPGAIATIRRNCITGCTGQ